MLFNFRFVDYGCLLCLCWRVYNRLHTVQANQLQILQRPPNHRAFTHAYRITYRAFLDYEQRDPFAHRQMKQEEPDVTAWERYARDEYQQLAMEEEERERQEDSDGYDDNQDWEVCGLKGTIDYGYELHLLTFVFCCEGRRRF